MKFHLAPIIHINIVSSIKKRRCREEIQNKFVKEYGS